MSWKLRESKDGQFRKPKLPFPPEMPKPPKKANPKDQLRPPKPPAPPGMEWFWSGK